MPGRDEPANYSKIFRGGATAMDMLDKDRADKATDDEHDYTRVRDAGVARLV